MPSADVFTYISGERRQHLVVFSAAGRNLRGDCVFMSRMYLTEQGVGLPSHIGVMRHEITIIKNRLMFVTCIRARPRGKPSPPWQ